MIKKWNSFTALLVITLVMVALMFMTIYRSHDDNTDFGLLYPSLFNQLGDVDKIKISGPEQQFVLNRKGNNWYIKNHYDYLANYSDVKRMLVDMAHAKIKEIKTSNPKLYPVIGVEGSPPKDKQGKSLTINLYHGDKELAGLVLGKQRPTTVELGPKDFYVRRVDDKRSYLVEGYLLISPVMLDWMQNTLMNIARERIAKLQITQPDGQTATLINLGEKNKFGTPDQLERTQFKYPQLGYDIAGTLHQLNLQDVKPKEGFDWAGKQPVIAKFTTFGGLVVTAKTVAIKGQFYSEFSAAYDPSVAQQPPADIKALHVVKTAEQIKKEVDALNKNLSPWVYQLSGFVGTNLMRQESDIIYSDKPQQPSVPLMQKGFGPRGFAPQ